MPDMADEVPDQSVPADHFSSAHWAATSQTADPATAILSVYPKTTDRRTAEAGATDTQADGLTGTGTGLSGNGTAGSVPADAGVADAGTAQADSTDTETGDAVDTEAADTLTAGADAAAEQPGAGDGLAADGLAGADGDAPAGDAPAGPADGSAPGDPDAATHHGRGSTTVADEVVEKIAGIAAREVSGVHDLGGDAARAVTAVRERIHLGQESAAQGVSVKLEGRTAEVRVVLVIDFGFHVYEVADQVREKVIASVEDMLGIQVTAVNVRVDDVHIPDHGHDDGEGLTQD